MLLRSLVLFVILSALQIPVFAQDAVQSTGIVPAAAETEDPAEASRHFTFVRYQADYQVNADATSEVTVAYEIIVHTKSGVDQFSQIRLGYSEKMETLEVLEAYTLTAEGERREVPQDRIYTQESYSSASAAMYADRKVKVIVFPNLAPGNTLVYRVHRRQTTPYFPGYFGLWETFNEFTAYGDVRVTLRAPENLPMHIFSRGLQGNDRPRIRQGEARWEWRYSRLNPMPNQNWSVSAWEYSPTLMVSTFANYAELGRAYQLKSGQAARVTPAIQAQAEQITHGIDDRREQAAALYEWVAKHIRYVAVYLGNGGLEPNSADSILENHYGDCKDHTVILEALLAAKGIVSTPALIGAGGGPTLPPVAMLGRFNHVITYVPEFDLYLDSTVPFARFGQLPLSDLGAPVVRTVDGTVTYTPADTAALNPVAIRVQYVFSPHGDVSGEMQQHMGVAGEISQRGLFSQINNQNRARIEETIITGSGFHGEGRLIVEGEPLDLRRSFGYSFIFDAKDYVDFDVVGGMALPDIPGADSMRNVYMSASAERNLTPFYCSDDVREETYVLQFPNTVPIIAIPNDVQFSNVAGTYTALWQREGQTVTVVHRLHSYAIHGDYALCKPEDYPAFRELYQFVRRGFRGQILYGDLRRVQTSQVSR